MTPLLGQRKFHVLLSCEHGGNRVPTPYAPLFEGEAAAEALASHRGWDPGALEIARAIAARIGAPLHESRVTRLLVELNRSLDSHQLFSEFTRDLPEATRAAIIGEYYLPFREATRQRIDSHIAAGQCVLHISIHTFTPVLDGHVRDVELGVLYDPDRPLETKAAESWLEHIAQLAPPQWRLGHNTPYRGTDDGHTTHLRQLYSPEHYAGIEIEANQALAADPTHQHQLIEVLEEATARLAESFAH